LGCGRFLPEFSQTCPKKVLYDFCLQIISSKRSTCVFLQTLATFFEVKKRWAPFLPGLSGILSVVSTIETFGGAPAPPPVTPLNKCLITCEDVAGAFVFCIATQFEEMPPVVIAPRWKHSLSYFPLILSELFQESVQLRHIW